MTPRIPEWVYDQGFSPAERDVYLYCWMRGACFDDKRKMAKRLGMGKDKLRACLSRLTEHDWLKKSAGTKSTCYVPQMNGHNMTLPKVMKPENMTLGRVTNCTGTSKEDLVHTCTSKESHPKSPFSDSSSRVSSEEEFFSSKLLFSERLSKPGKVANTGLEVATFTLNGKTFSSDTKEDIRGYYMQFIRNHGKQRERWPKLSKIEKDIIRYGT